MERQQLAFTINDAARAVGLSRSTIYRLIAAKQLRTIRIGSRTLIPTASLQQLCDEAASA